MKPMTDKSTLQTFVFGVGEPETTNETIAGPKAASLFKLYAKLGKETYQPNTEVIGVQLYHQMVERAGLVPDIKKWAIEHEGWSEKEARMKAADIRNKIVAIKYTKEEEHILGKVFQRVKKRGGAVMVRSSATIENLPGKSFAGQHDTFANITTKADFLRVIKQCMASLFTDRAIAYRDAHAFDHKTAAMAVLVQEMIRPADVVSGVAFSHEPETCFDRVMVMTANYGLGESMAQGKVVPDRFVLFSDGIQRKKDAIVQRTLGTKEIHTVPRARKGTKQQPLPAAKRNAFCLTDAQVIALGRVMLGLKKEIDQPFECEWVFHPKKHAFSIVQIRFREPLKREPHTLYQYTLKRTSEEIGRGIAIGHGIASGTVKVVNTIHDLAKVKDGDILVAKHTDPAWAAVMKKVHGIITEEGGKTSHAATAARELQVPAIVGVKDARTFLKNRQRVTLQSAAGDVGLLYKGLLPYEKQRVAFEKLPSTKTQLTVRMQDPDHAYAWATLPKDGFGVVDQADVVAHFLRIHPLALLEYTKIQQKGIKAEIAALTRGYRSKRAFAKEKLAEGIARLAVAAFDNPVYIKLSDYRSEQYTDLIGASHVRTYMRKSLSGVSLYNNKAFQQAFALECEAIAMVRKEWGLHNVVPVVPFCRTPEEAEAVLQMMKENGLERGKDGLRVHILCDLPANVVLAEDFSRLFDGVTIQADTLATEALGVGKDVLEEKASNLGARMLEGFIADVVKKAHQQKTLVHVFGQLLEENEAFLDAVVKSRVDAIAVHPDALVQTRKRVAMVESTVGRTGKKTHKGFLSLVMVLGFMGVGILGVGAGCGVPVEPTAPQEPQVTPAQIREEAMKQVEVALAAKEADYVNQTQTMRVRSFANFSFDHPAIWTVDHWNGGVSVQHPTSTGYVSIYEPVIAPPVNELPSEQAIIGGKVWTVYSLEEEEIRKIALFEDELVIEGMGPAFDTAVQSFSFGTDEQVTERPLTHWDLREKRLCAQVVTYARQEDGGSCELFSTPCEVPSGWDVCDASEE